MDNQRQAGGDEQLRGQRGDWPAERGPTEPQVPSSAAAADGDPPPENGQPNSQVSER